MPYPLISLVTCSYQQGKFLESTLRSVLEQGYERLQYIVIDGGSTDESVDVIRRHEERLSYWVSERDRGQTHALNKGFEQCTGDVLGWLCSDDLLLPGALETVGRFFQDNPQVDWVYGDAVWIDALGHAIRSKREMPWNRTVFLFDHNFLAQPSVFWRRSLFEKVGGLREEWNLAMDSDLWLRFAQVSHPLHVPRYLSGLRYYPEQKTRALRPAGRLEDEALRQREAPLMATLPRWPVKTMARGLRICSKALHGGYGNAVPHDVRTWLQALELPG